MRNKKLEVRSINVEQQPLKDRTKKFGLRVIKLADALPKSYIGKITANQILRSSTSVGSNYRASCRARSKAEFIAKLGICLEESDECCYWLEIIMDANLLPIKKVQSLYNEADELTAIFVSAIKKAKKK